MGIFSNKKKRSVFDDPEGAVFPADPPTDYNNTVDYLVGLSSEDYDKVFKVANIYRTANIDAALALGVPNEPTTFINNPTGKISELPQHTVSDSGDFLSIASEPKQKRSTKPKKPTLKQGKKSHA